MPLKKRLVVSSVVVGALLIAGAIVGGGWLKGSKSAASRPEKPAPLVSIATVVQRELPIKLTTQGHVVSLNQVDVRPQVNGTVRSVTFHEGDEVRAGQVLFTLDASDASAQLSKAQASAAQIQAQASEAQRELTRARELLTSRFITATAVDTSVSKLEALQAQYRASLADVASAKVLLARATISSPMTGVAGAVTVHAGSLAQTASAAPLVNIVQLDPIGVEFSLPESDLSNVVAARAAGVAKVFLTTVDSQEIAGQLTFINNTVNTDSGTINMKAAFGNAGRKLWPGSFVRLTIDAGVSHMALVLPPQAIVEGPKGRIVYVVDASSKVTAVPVTLLRIQDQQAVVSGLRSGEQVVSEGSQGLTDGMTVRVAPAAAATQTPSARPPPRAAP